MIRHGSLFVLALGLGVGLVGCPSSEDDGDPCRGGQCGPGVCLVYCGGDAAKDAPSVDATKDVVVDAAPDQSASDASGDAGDGDASVDAGGG